MYTPFWVSCLTIPKREIRTYPKKELQNGVDLRHKTGDAMQQGLSELLQATLTQDQLLMA